MGGTLLTCPGDKSEIEEWSVDARKAGDIDRRKGRRPEEKDLSSAPERVSPNSLARFTSILRSHGAQMSLPALAPGAERHVAIPRRRQEEDLTLERLIF